MKDAINLYESTQDLMLCELEKIVQKNEVSPQTLDFIDKIVDIIKDLYEVTMDEESRMGYSDGYSGRAYYRGNSYKSMGNGYDGSYRGNSMRYMSDGYSKGNSKKGDMLEHLYLALDNASNEEERKRVKRMIDDIENS